MGICLLWATQAHEYLAIFVNIYWYHTWGYFKRAGGTTRGCVILTKLDQHANEMMAVAVKNVLNFNGHVFLKSDKTLTWPPMQFFTVV